LADSNRPARLHGGHGKESMKQISLSRNFLVKARRLNASTTLTDRSPRTTEFSFREGWTTALD
jgi:hypothetical protein